MGICDAFAIGAVSVLVWVVDSVRVSESESREEPVLPQHHAQLDDVVLLLYISLLRGLTLYRARAPPGATLRVIYLHLPCQITSCSAPTAPLREQLGTDIHFARGLFSMRTVFSFSEWHN